MPSSVKAIAGALALLACSSGASGADPVGPARAIGYGSYDETGLSSWYGEELAGNRTASGDRFDPDAITVAHRSLPLGSFVEITSVETGRSILARVNDRGPGRRDRLVDLSHGAARLLGTDRRATARVRIRAIVPSIADAETLRAGRAVAAREDGPGLVRAASDDLPALRRRPLLPSPTGRYVVQIGTFSNRARAEALAHAVGAAPVSVGNFWRVRLGPFQKPAAAQDARDAIARRGYGDAQILPED